MPVAYLDNDLVSAIKITDAPPNRSATGYGGRIPTRYMLRLGKRWHRVYMMQYGNAGTPYVRTKGGDRVLEIETEHRIDRHRDGAGPDVCLGTLTPGQRFRFHHDGVVCTLQTLTEGGAYRWRDYQGDHRLHAGTYSGTGKVAWPWVYPTEDPETRVTTANGEYCPEFAANGSCIHSDHTR